MKDPASALQGPLLIDRFELRAVLGEGGMGVVHRAFDSELGVEVALKTLPAQSSETVYSLKEEFRAAAGIVHPNLVELYELFARDARCFFTMELIDGVPFTEFVRHGWESALSNESSSIPHSSRTRRTQRRGPLPAASLDPALLGETTLSPMPAWSRTQTERLLHAAAQLVRAASALHRAARLHCDIKPSNALVTADGRVVVLDFGLSWSLLTEGRRESFVGTPAYAAPEQLWGGRLTPATDLYSIGILLYEALVGAARAEAYQTRAQQMLPVELDRNALPAGLPPDFVSLLERLLCSDPKQRPGAHDALRILSGDVAALGEVGVSTGQPFVDREAETRELEGAFSTCSGRELVLVEVRGESGIGKTELVRRFTRWAAKEPETLVLRGQCRLQESVPYQALDEIVDDLGEYISAMPAPEQSLVLTADLAFAAELFPAFRRFFQQPSQPQNEDAQRRRQRGTRALRELFVNVAKRRKTVIWIDDAHWGDQESEQLLRELLRDPAPPILLVLSYPTQGDAVPWVGTVRDIVGEARGRRISLTLGPLDRESSIELAAELLGGGDATRENVLGRIAVDAGLAPMFVAQLCRLALERRQHSSAANVEADLADVIAHRLDSLERQDQLLVELTALAERPLDGAILIEAASIGASGRLALFRLCGSQFLRLLGRRPSPVVGIYHQRIRECILARLDADRLREHHAALARALANAGVDDSELLFRHWAGAQEWDKAATCAADAAARASAQLAFNHAVELYDRALSLFAGDPARRASFLRGRAEALSLAGRSAEAARCYLELSASEPEHAERVRLLQLAAEQFLIGGHIDSGLDVLSHALTESGVPFPASAGRAMLGVLASIAKLRLAGARAFRLAKSARDSAVPLAVDTCLSAAKGFAAVDPARSAYFGFLALDLARRAGDTLRLGSALSLVGMMSAAVGGPLRAWGERCLDEAQAIGVQRDDKRLIGGIEVCRAQAELNRGEWRLALEHCDQGLAWIAKSGGGAAWEYNLAQMGSIRALEELGRLERAWARAREWWQDAEARGDLYARVTAELYLGFADLAYGKPERAAEAATAAMSPWPERSAPFQEFYRLRLQAYAHIYEATYDEAEKVVDAAERGLRDAQLLRLPMARLELSLLRARIVLGRAQNQPVVERQLLAQCDKYCRALSGLRRADALGWASTFRAAMAALAGARDRALALLDEAERHFRREHMAACITYVRERRGRLLGGAEGAEAVAQSRELLNAEGIVAPDAWLALHVPGIR
jgi:serine/threonine protein kinase